MEEQRSAARASIIRTAVIYTPLLLAILAGWGAALASVLEEGGGGGIPLLVVLGLLALLVGFQSIQSLRDVWGEPRVTRGEIVRKWKRADLLVFPGYYFYVKKTVFRVAPLIYHQLEEGDTVSVTHYPHTATVVTVEPAQSEEEGRTGSATPS